MRGDEPAVHLDPWLFTMLGLGHGAGVSFGRPSVTPGARKSGLADPAMRWAGTGFYRGGTLAQVTARAISEDTSGQAHRDPHAVSSRAEPRAGSPQMARDATTFTIAW
jgi:hypothetical protein